MTTLSETLALAYMWNYGETHRHDVIWDCAENVVNICVARQEENIQEVITSSGTFVSGVAVK